MRIYAVDVDGCLFENKWPVLGEPNYNLIEWLNEEQLRGNKVILWTCREGQMLKEAVSVLERLGFIPDAVNENLPVITAKFGNDCRKVYAHCYIDDSNAAPIEFGLPFHPDETQAMPRHRTAKKKEPIDRTPQTMRIV